MEKLISANDEDRGSLSLYLFLFFIVIFFCGALNPFFTDAHGLEDPQKSFFNQWAKRCVIFFPVVIMFVRNAEFKRISLNSKLIFLFLLYCILNLTNAVDKGVSAAWISTVIIQILLVISVRVVTGRIDFLRFFVHFMAWSMLATLVFIALFPQFGILQAGDITQAGAAGEWRGFYGSKNAMGHVASIYTGALLAFGGHYMRNRLVYFVALFAGLLCTVMSKSGTALVLVVFVFTIFQLVKNGAGIKFYLFTASIFLAATLFIADPELVGTILKATLSKDATLSGRTEIWSFAAKYISHRLLTGYGAGHTVSPGFLLVMNMNFGLPHFHNAYLDTLANGGVIGFILFYGFHINAARRALGWRNLSESEMRARAAYVALLAGFLFSGVTEIDGSRASGPLPTVALVASIGLLSLRQTVPAAQKQAAGLRPIGKRLPPTATSSLG